MWFAVKHGSLTAEEIAWKQYLKDGFLASQRRLDAFHGAPGEHMKVIGRIAFVEDVLAFLVARFRHICAQGL
jgi:hypothetical protein